MGLRKRRYDDGAGDDAPQNVRSGLRPDGDRAVEWEGLLVIGVAAASIPARSALRGTLDA